MEYILDQTRLKLKQEIEHAIKQFQVSDLPPITLEVPKERAHGDFSTNIAMQLVKALKKNPREIAESLKATIDLQQAGVDRIEVAGPGFINFYMDKSYLYEVVPQVLAAQADYGSVNLGQGRKVQVEFVSANPTGSLHLGHARGAAVGDALCNLLAFAGYEVSREYYINDAGNQVNNLAKSLEVRYLQALGQQAEMPEDGYYGEDIVIFAKQLAEQEGDRLTKLEATEREQFFLSFGLEKQLEKIKTDLQRFGVKFDVWFSESSLYEDDQIEAVLAELRKQGHIYEQDGATWLRTTDFGDDKDRVLIKNDGSFTYLTPDIAYHQNKFSRQFDQLINIWGADHHGYIPRMKAAMLALGYESERLTVLIAQMVSLFQQGEKVKMSKRTGKAVTMEELMDEVGVDAIRYFFTMRSMDSHLDFDLDLAVSKSNENPVFYVQYAFARISSIFRQAEQQGVSLQEVKHISLNRLTSEAEHELLLKLAEFGDEVRLAAEQYAPHRIVRYAYELAALFHSYYRAERVMTDDLALTQARLALLKSIQITIGNAMSMIGVSCPEQM